MGTDNLRFTVLHEELPHVALKPTGFTYLSIEHLFHITNIVMHEKWNCKVMVFLFVCFVMF